MYDRKKPFKVQIESAGPWSEKNREMFIELVAEAIALFWSDPANREAFKKQMKEESSESV